MTTVYDVPPNKLIEEVTKKLKDEYELEVPEWAPYVKTGRGKEKAPLQSDWWYRRNSAILRTVYLKGPIGISKLCGKYGCKDEKGTSPKHATKGSGAIIRTALQQLEDRDLVKKEDGGRIITAEGRSLLDNLSDEILKDMAKDDPEMSKYL